VVTTVAIPVDDSECYDADKCTFDPRCPLYQFACRQYENTEELRGVGAAKTLI